MVKTTNFLNYVDISIGGLAIGDQCSNYPNVETCPVLGLYIS